MLYTIIAGVVIVAGLFYFFSKGDKDLARSQDYPTGFAHSNQTEAAVAQTEAV